MSKNCFGIHVIATGDPASGFELIGPFNNAEEAIEWADRVLDTREWWALPLVGQDSAEDRAMSTEIERATSIEFDDKAQYWRVHDTEGFAMFNSPSRQECLEWERQHLESLEDMKHEFSDRAGAVAAGT